jgi:hypothetical protein
MNCGKHLLAWFAVFSFLSCSVMNAQQASLSGLPAAVPRLVSFSGKAIDAQGKTITGIAGVSFAIYADQFGGAPLWMEIQNVQAGTKGTYTVQLGATKADGLPLDLFTSGAARWLGVTINGGEEQPRILLLSVPYALKAADAETVGGLPASAFVLANGSLRSGAKVASTPTPASAQKNAAEPANPEVTGKGVVNFIPMWNSTSDIVDSLVFQKTSKIGINTTAPAATLDVNGKSAIRDTVTLFPKGSDSTLSVSGTSFNIDNTGRITFISGQNFPGTGDGTITGVTAGTDLTGGGTSGAVTLNLDVTKVPQLNANNAFTGSQGVVGSLSVTTSVRGGLAGLGNFSSSGTSDSNSVTISNGTGTTETFQAGCDGCFVPGAQAGDGGLRVKAGRNIFFGDPNASRLELDSSGNAFQPLAANGIPKALFFYSPFSNGGAGSFLHCFNSTLSGAAATTPPCGFSVIEKFEGDYVFDLGFQIDNRILSSTPNGNAGNTIKAAIIVATCTDVTGVGEVPCNNPSALNSHRAEVTSLYVCDFSCVGGFTDSMITLIVY